MKRKKSKATSPLIRLVGLEAAAAAASIAGSPAMAAPGDLDPSFGDAGRFMSSRGSLWSIDVQADDAVLFAGGDAICDTYYGCEYFDFTGRLLRDGTPDASFAAAALESTVVFDTALQTDGKVVAAGRARQPDGNDKLQVFRLRPDGSLDPDFGLGGVVLAGDGVGHSVAVDPDGRIVVAGTRRVQSGVQGLLLVRLQPNGALDASFGTGGTFVTPDSIGFGGYPARIARAAGGGYRVMAHPGPAQAKQSCSVFAVTDTGVLDAAFGIAGVAAAPFSDAATAKGIVNCTSLAVQSDGRVLLGGRRANVDEAYFSRLLANGVPDTSFAGVAATAQLRSVTALALGSSGAMFVAGTDRTGLSGAVVVRLLADGTLDTLYGRNGAARVDLEVSRATAPAITDMKVTRNDGLVVGGKVSTYGTSVFEFNHSPLFVARLLGTGGGGGPGVLSMMESRALGSEQGGRATLSVSRVGGGTGAIAVTYVTGDARGPGPIATAGQDYTASTGRLTWADGDVGDKEIVVPIASDTNAETPEFFEVVLQAPEGGAGLGAKGADVEIAGEGYPVGQFNFEGTYTAAPEGAQANVVVRRDFYSQGAASVTVRVAGGTATPGKDFGSPGDSAAWQDVVLTWSDGDARPKLVSVLTNRDRRNETAETIALELISPTGGAALGTSRQATVSIGDTTTGSAGGGGSFGWLGAMLLGLGGALRRRLTGNR